MSKAATKGMPFPIPARDTKSSQGTGDLAQVFGTFFQWRRQLSTEQTAREGLELPLVQDKLLRPDETNPVENNPHRLVPSPGRGLTKRPPDIPDRPILQGSAGVQLRCRGRTGLTPTQAEEKT